MRLLFKKLLRRVYLELKNKPDTLEINDQKLYEKSQFRPGQMEYIHPRQMIESTIEYFLPMIESLCVFKKIDKSLLKILDVGARDGWTVEKFTELGFNAAGIELVSELVEHAKLKGRNVEKGDAHNLKFNDKSFDVIFCRHTLEHTTNPIKVISELVRVTSSGGLILISLPLESSASGKHMTAIPNLRVLKSLVKGMQVCVIKLTRSIETNTIIPDDDEALMILRKL